MKKISTAKLFTTTISASLLSWLNEESMNQNITKRALLEKALLFYKTEERRRKMADSFKLAAQDGEMVWMAESGLEDFEVMLKQFDQKNL